MNKDEAHVVSEGAEVTRKWFNHKVVLLPNIKTQNDHFTKCFAGCLVKGRYIQKRMTTPNNAIVFNRYISKT